jgi:restriction system protein
LSYSWQQEQQMSDNKLLPPSGGYRKLRSFRYAQAIYDGTMIFCNRFISKKSRTHDQMVQAARSGVQNIAEGSLASATSKKTEIKLTGVARASLGELMLDYEDFLRQNNLRQWDKADPEALVVRDLWKRGMSDQSDLSDPSDLSILYRFTELQPEVLANTLICLINQVSYLLWRQMKSQEKDFLDHGGFTERMYRARKNRGTES